MMPTTEPPKNIQRQTAYKCNIATLNKGVFVKKTGWESSYLITDYGDFSRVNIIAVIIEREENRLMLEDGTGKINATVFEKGIDLDSFEVGNIVLIIGRPREYNNETYLSPEIIKKIEKGWIIYRKKELGLLKVIRNVEEIKPDIVREEEPVESTGTVNAKTKLVKLIKELDDGNGADIDNIIKLSKISAAEDLINDMLLKGEIYEIKPGKIKILL